MKDPLIINYKGKTLYKLNARMVERQNLSPEDIEVVKALHLKRIALHEVMETADESLLKELDEKCTKLEFEIQKAWGFKKDAKRHRFWERPRCSCPSMDNNDNYPTGIYSIDQGCLLHGSVKPKQSNTNSTVDNRERRFDLNCSFCPPNRGENKKRVGKHGKTKPKRKNKR